MAGLSGVLLPWFVFQFRTMVTVDEILKDLTLFGCEFGKLDAHARVQV